MSDKLTDKMLCLNLSTQAKYETRNTVRSAITFSFSFLYFPFKKLFHLSIANVTKNIHEIYLISTRYFDTTKYKRCLI